MTVSTTTLRPGFIVSLKTSVRGNVSYFKKALDAEGEEIKQSDDPNAPTMSVAKWETTRTIVDPAEHERAKKARSKASATIRAVCRLSAFGLLCPEADAEKLDKAVADARAVVAEFNATSMISCVDIFVMKGRVSPDDVEALKAINSEVRELMEQMESGIKELDVKAIRDAASRAKELGGMLSADYEAKVQIAVEAARTAAKKIVSDGQGKAQIDNSAVNKIESMRKSFLDLDAAADVAAPKTAAPTLDLVDATVWNLSNADLREAEKGEPR